MKSGPLIKVSSLAYVANTIKFSLISSENKLVTQLNIYLVNISNLFVFDLAIKQTVLI